MPKGIDHSRQYITSSRKKEFSLLDLYVSIGVQLQKLSDYQFGILSAVYGLNLDDKQVVERLRGMFPGKHITGGSMTAERKKVEWELRLRFRGIGILDDAITI